MAVPFQKFSEKFLFKSLTTSKPPDAMGPGEYARVENVRSYVEGTLETRPGLTLINAAPLPEPTVHSIRRLNDPSGSFRVLGAGTALYTGVTSFTQRATGLSGRPLSMCHVRPDRNPTPWMYVADSLKMLKVGVVSGVPIAYQMGVAPPLVPPAATLGRLEHVVVDDFEATAGWAGGGAAPGALALAAPKRVNTTISRILFDVGATGWASVVPAAMTDGLKAGSRVAVSGAAEIVLVDSTYPKIPSTTINSIAYETSSTGVCSIDLRAPSKLLRAQMALLLNAGQPNEEMVRVRAVVEGPDGLVSIITSTALLHVATETVDGLDSFRAYFINTHAAADTLVDEALDFTISAAGVTYLSKGATLDLSKVDLGGSAGRPLGDDDLIHISVRLSDPSKLSEGQVQIDVDSATNDFTRNYYFYPFRANDLTPSAKQTASTLSVQQREIQRDQIDPSPQPPSYIEQKYSPDYDPYSGYPQYGETVTYGINNVPAPPPSSLDLPQVSQEESRETTLGDAQWTELVFRIGDLTRAGSDASRTLREVKAIRVSFNVTAAVTVQLDSWWVGGSYGADYQPGLPYRYSYTFRSKITGARSNPSPPMRETTLARRHRVLVSGRGSADAQVDQVDIFRQGGTLSEFVYLGSVPNPGAGGTWSFSDEFSDTNVRENRQLEFNNFQPFPTVDRPRAGVANVKGTVLERVSGDTFLTSWARGSIVIVDGVPTTLYTSPQSAGRLELEQSLGTRTSVSFEVPEATRLAQALPSMWGPFTGGGLGPVLFACGDPQEPGTLYWTKPNDPDAAPDTNFLELTSPSEPLVAGCMYDGRPIVFSTERMFAIYPDGDGGFTAQEVANSKGLYSRHALAVGPLIYFLAKDGIYVSEGGEPRSITNEHLYTLFPHDGQPGRASYAALAPDYGSPENLRLHYYDQHLYFDYRGAGSFERQTLVYDEKRQGWYLDRYTPQMVCHYGEEGESLHSLLLGGSNGRIYQFGGLNDAGTGINCLVRTRSVNMGLARDNKLFGDVMMTSTPTASRSTPQSTSITSIRGARPCRPSSPRTGRRPSRTYWAFPWVCWRAP